MKIHQILDEYSVIDPGIIAALKEKGYKYINKGVDQAAFLEPGTGDVLKIFGTGYDADVQTDGGKQKPNFSSDQKMFFKWAKYCNQVKNNPFLPKFGGFESFYWGNKVYLQIRQERLRELPRDIGLILAQMSYSAESGSSYERMKKSFDVHENWYSLRVPFERFKAKLGESGLKLLYKTIVRLTKMGERNDWSNDLHRGNFMMRRDGTPVIVDPWTVD